LDRAAPADARIDRITPGAEHVSPGLQVETGVEVERRAILVELSPDSRTIPHHKIDPFGTRQQRALNGSGGNAPGPFPLDPIYVGDHAMRLNRNAKDHLVLNNKAGDAFAHGRGLCGEEG